MSRKIEPNIPKNMNSEETFVSAKVRFRKKRIGSIGAGARSSQSTNSTSTIAPATSEPKSGEVEAVGWAVRFAQAEERQRREHEPDRDVDPEDPLPGEPLDDRAADERTDRDREPADLPRNRCRKEREGQRRHDRAANSL